MEPITTIATTLAGLRNSIDIAKAAITARDEMKLAELEKSLNKAILDVNSSALELLGKLSAARDEIDALKDGKRQIGARVAELEHQKLEREKYELHELSQGVFVLAEVEPRQDGRSPYYLCQPCMDNEAKKVVLQRKGGPMNVSLVCNNCRAAYFTGEKLNDMETLGRLMNR